MVRACQPKPSKSRSIFVGGVKGNTQKNEVFEYFSQFGLVEHIEMKSKFLPEGWVNTGFCVVTFEHEASALDVLNYEPHYIGDRLVACRNFLKGKALKQNKHIKDERKLFVCHLPPETKDSELEAFFSEFGPVESAYTIKEEECKISKGFGFVTYKNIWSLSLVLKLSGEIFLNGSKLKICRFIDTSKLEKQERESKNNVAELSKFVGQAHKCQLFADLKWSGDRQPLMKSHQPIYGHEERIETFNRFQHANKKAKVSFNRNELSQALTPFFSNQFYNNSKNFSNSISRFQLNTSKPTLK